MTMFRKIGVQTVAIVSMMFLFGTGCSKVDEPASYDVWLPQTIKDIFLVQPGTYWIMKEASFGVDYFDSVYVTETIHDTIDIINPGSHQAFAHKDRFIVKCLSSFYGTEFHIISESADLVNDMNRQEPCYFVAIENYNTAGSITARSRIYYYPDVVDQGWSAMGEGLGGAKVQIDSVLTSYTLDGQLFSNVKRVDTELDKTQRDSRSIRYIAPEAGIIQTIVPAYGTNWFMVRNRIVR
jgi:hypothetical protein